MPFIPKIESRDLAQAMIEGALMTIANQNETARILTNQQIKDLLAQAR